MKQKQIQRRRKQRPLCDRHVLLFLITTLTAACLTGCGAVCSDQVKDLADQTKNMANQVSLKPGIQKQMPDIPYSDQIDTIIQNKDVWSFPMPADVEEDEYKANCYYSITDMDQNGYLEVISRNTMGTLNYSYNEYYEVSQDGKSLIKLETDEREDELPVLWFLGENSQGYYDGKTGTYHYPQLNHIHWSGLHTTIARLDIVLSDGKVAVNTISLIESDSYGEHEEKDHGCVIKYYAGNKTEELGEIKEPYDEKRQKYIHDTEQESEYDKQLEELQEQYYEGMQEFTVTSDSFRSIDEIEYKKSEKKGEDIRCYHSYTSRGEGYESVDILQFVWKRGEGLIGMRDATHAAGGGGKFFWKEGCLKPEDVGFPVD